MKEKNFPNNNNLKSLDELTNEANQIIENKFQASTKNISSETKDKINKIIKKT